MRRNELPPTSLTSDEFGPSTDETITLLLRYDRPEKTDTESSTEIASKIHVEFSRRGRTRVR